MKAHKDIELRSEEVQEVMSEISPAIVRWGITVVFLVVAVLIAGCFVFKYPDVVNASVTLTTQDPPAAVVARATGKMDEIYVRNNQEVKAGQALGVVQNSANTSDVLLLSHQLDAWKNQQQNLDSAQTLFLNERTLQLGSIQTSYTTFLSLLKEYVDFRALKYYPRKIDLQKNEVNGQQENVDEMQRRSRLMKQQLETELSTFKRDSVLYRKGIVSEENFDAAKSKILQMRQTYSALRSSIKQSEIQITQSRESLLDLQQNYAVNENKYWIGLRTTFEQLTTEIKIWERSFLLVSPVDGVVSLMGFWSNNQNVESGETVFTVRPALAVHPVGKALMPVQGSGKVRINQRANVRLNNFPDQEFGYLQGIVRNVSPTPNADGKYVVEIYFPHGLVTNYHKKLPITRQMEGVAEIITEDIRLIERFFNPIKRILKKYS